MAKTAFGFLTSYVFLVLTAYSQSGPVLRNNFAYICNNERVIVGRCRRDSDTPDLPPTKDEDNYCQVVYPDRPKRGGFTVETVELRSDVIKKLVACGAFAPPTSSQPSSSALSTSADAIALGRAVAGPQLWVDEARKLRAAGNEAGALAKFDSAVKKYKEIIENYPHSRYPGVTSAYLGLGGLYMNDLRRYDLALPVVQALRKLQPNDATNAILVGQTLYQLKRRDEALQAFREALALKPKPQMAAITHLSINYIYKDQGLYDKAVLECQEVLRIDPVNSGAYHSLGTNYYYLKDHSKAIDAFQQAIKLKYTPVEQTYNWIGYIYNELEQHDKALPVLQTVLAIKPDYANTHGNLGLAYIGLKRYPEAVSSIQQAIKLDPANSQSRYNLGYAYVKMGKKADATAVYNQLLSMDKAKAQELSNVINNPSTATGPNSKTNKSGPPTAGSQSASEHYALGVKYSNAKESQKAIAEFQKVIALKPEKKMMIATYTNLAGEYLVLHQLDKAIPNYIQLTFLEPTDNSTFWALGDLYFKVQQYAKSAAAFKEALRLKPTDKFYHSELASAYLMLGQKAEAMRVYDSLLKIDKEAAKSLLDAINDPGGPAAILASKSFVSLLNTVEGLDEKPEALGMLRAALRIKPANPYGLIKVGDAFALFDHHDEAIAAYRSAIKLNPKNETQAQALGSIGQAYNALNQFAKAVPEIKESLRLKPNDYYSRELGNSYWGLKDYPNALASYQEAARLKPDNVDGHRLIGMAYAAMNQFDNAIAAYTEVARLEPKSGRGLAEIGKINFQLKKYNDAGRAFSAALRIDPKNKDALMGIGKTYLAVGRKADAMKAYNALKPLDEKLAAELLANINR